MGWQDQYALKLHSAEEALRLVTSGSTVWMHTGCAYPETLAEALTAAAPRLRNVQVVHMLAIGGAPYTAPGLERSFRVNAPFIGSSVREAVEQGRGDYTPVFLQEVESLLESGALHIDTALLQVSTPDRHGFMSLGAGVDCSLTAARCARNVIVEVNNRAPRILGDSCLHVSQVTSIVETSHALTEYTAPPLDDVERRIAANVASLIPDGAMLQLGIGGVPDAVLSFLADRHDLGLHSEMFSDSVIPLIEAGVLNGRRNTLHPYRLVAGFVVGSHALFDYIDDNPLFEFHPTRYVNDPFVIAQHDNMIAINSALQVDITGQVCADSIGSRPYSGFGGQVDFMRGAARSRGGKPIIALRSTADEGRISRIAEVLHPGAGVVTSRADVHYIVTEHGIAYLHGKTLRQRAEALIAIADPRFRDELAAFACGANVFAAR